MKDENNGGIPSLLFIFFYLQMRSFLFFINSSIEEGYLKRIINRDSPPDRDRGAFRPGLSEALRAYKKLFDTCGTT